MQPGAATVPAARTRAGWSRLWTPSVTDFFFGAFLVWSFAAGAGWEALLTDGDTGFHIRTGDFIRQTGSVPAVDIFSFSKEGAPWFAWEWLSALAFSAVHGAAHLKGVVFFSGVVLTLAAALVFRYALWRGSQFFPAFLLTVAAGGAAWVHFLARPHIFTFLLLPVALWLLERDRRVNSAAIWWLIPLTVVWTNLHGGFLAVVACGGIYALGVLLEGAWKTGSLFGGLAQARRFGLVTAGCAAASLVNPYGWNLHLHLTQFFATGAWWQKVIQEFEPPRVGDPRFRHFEILLILSLGWIALYLRRKRVVEPLLILFWAHQALSSVRHVSLFGWVVAPLLAEEVTALWREWSRSRPARSAAAILGQLDADFSRKPMGLSAWPLALLVFLWWSPWQAWPKDFPAAKYPLALISRYESALAPADGPAPRILASDDYGDYLIYRFHPRLKVFIDGRGDFYGPEFQREAARLLAGKHPWRETLERYDFDWALLSVNWSLAETLKLLPGWRLVADDGRTLLFQRRKTLMKLGGSVE